MSDIVARLDDAEEIVLRCMEPSQWRNNVLVRLGDAKAEIERLQRIHNEARVLGCKDCALYRHEIEQLRELLEQCCGIRWRPWGHMEDSDE